GVFSLERWSSQIPTEFLVFRRTQDPLRRKFPFDYRAVTFFGWSFQTIHLRNFLITPDGVSYNPRRQAFWFRLIPFRSPLLGKSRLLSLPPGTEMFQFPGCTLYTLCIQVYIPLHYETWVAPIGKPRIKRLLTTPRGIAVLVPSFIGS